MNKIFSIAFAFLFLTAFAFPQMNDGLDDNKSNQDKIGISDDLLILPISENTENGSNELGEEEVDLFSVSEEDLALIADITDIEVTGVASASALLNNSRFMNCFSPEIKSEVLVLYTRYMKAQSSNDSGEIASIKEEALQMKERLREELASCSGKSGSKRSDQVQAMNQEMNQVISSYTERIRNLSTIEDVNQRNTEREQIKTETMTQIKAIVQERKQANASDLAAISGQVKIMEGKILLNGSEINSTGVSVMVRMRNRTMNVSSIAGALSINALGLQIRIPSMEVSENGTVTVNGSVLGLSPEEVQERIRIKVNSMQLVRESGTLMYQASGDEERKLLGLFKIKLENKVKLNAENGQVLSEERPWWAFLTTE